jgi:hypothetical protein
MERMGLMRRMGHKVVARHPRSLQLDSVLRCQRSGREGRACCRLCIVVLYGCIFSRLAGRFQGKELDSRGIWRKGWWRGGCVVTAC